MNATFLLFPQVTLLDLVGPLQVLHRVPGLACHLVAASREPVPSDCGLTAIPTATYADAPPADVLVVPGGYGVEGVLRDPVALAFVAAQAAGARWVTSVCTGALILGKVGALRGRRATTHAGYLPLLADAGAIPVAERVVRDGNVLTGGGVTAGLDFGLILAAALAGEAEARRIAVTLEYRPEPPFVVDAPPPDLAALWAGRRDVLRPLITG